jgi:hypothetical protein
MKNQGNARKSKVRGFEGLRRRRGEEEKSENRRFEGLKV